jgi:hypothetical protein
VFLVCRVRRSPNHIPTHLTQEAVCVGCVGCVRCVCCVGCVSKQSKLSFRIYMCILYILQEDGYNSTLYGDEPDTDYRYGIV